MKMWLCVENTHESSNGVVFHIVGVFDSEEKALKACNKDNIGYGPLTLNEPFPSECVEWEGFRYPNLENKND